MARLQILVWPMPFRTAGGDAFAFGIRHTSFVLPLELSNRWAKAGYTTVSTGMRR